MLVASSVLLLLWCCSKDGSREQSAHLVVERWGPGSSRGGAPFTSMAFSIYWGPFLGCPFYKSLTTLGSKLGRLIVGIPKSATKCTSESPPFGSPAHPAIDDFHSSKPHHEYLSILGSLTSSQPKIYFFVSHGQNPYQKPNSRVICRYLTGCYVLPTRGVWTRAHTNNRPRNGCLSR